MRALRRAPIARLAERSPGVDAGLGVERCSASARRGPTSAMWTEAIMRRTSVSSQTIPRGAAISAIAAACRSSPGRLRADLQLLERDVTVDLRLLRQTEHALPDDVALHLVGPAGDARRRGRQDAERPARLARV